MWLGKAWAQDPAPAAGQAATTEEDKRDEETRRLPLYFAQVIAPYQRERIATIQKKYEDQIKALQEQIASLLKQRDQEVESILVPEQREALQKIREEARQKAALAAEKRKAQAAAENAAPPSGAANP
jgi:TolA-binding protein